MSRRSTRSRCDGRRVRLNGGTICPSTGYSLSAKERPRSRLTRSADGRTARDRTRSAHSPPRSRPGSSTVTSCRLRVAARTVINFWAPWCAPCNVELPQLVSLAERFGDEVDFVGMSVELADLESVRASIDRFAIPYAQFLADEVVMERFFGTRDEAALPSTYVFDHAGRLRRLFRGAITEADLDALLLSFRDEGVFEADLELVARTSFRAGDYEEAIAYYRRLIDLDPRRVQPLYQIGLASLRLGNLEAAREALEQVVARSPTNALAQFNLGLVRFRSGEVGDALRSFQAASDLSGNDHVVLQQLGNAAAEAGQFWLAGDALDRATALNSTSAALWADKARVHRSRGQIDRARESYTRALEDRPGECGNSSRARRPGRTRPP